MRPKANSTKKELGYILAGLLLVPVGLSLSVSYIFVLGGLCGSLAAQSGRQTGNKKAVVWGIIVGVVNIVLLTVAIILNINAHSNR